MKKMVLYDNLEDIQVKCFYYQQILPNGKISSLGGNMYSFKLNDIVPWKTFCYNYSPNFYIVCINKDGYVVYEVKMGQFKGITTDYDFSFPFINIEGEFLKITSKEDLDDYSYEYIQQETLCSDKIKCFALDPSISAMELQKIIKKNSSKYKRKSFEYFNKRWIKPIPKYIKTIGSFLYSYYFAETETEKEEIKKLFTKKYNGHEKTVNKYIEWFNSDISCVYNNHFERGKPFYLDISQVIEEMCTY